MNTFDKNYLLLQFKEKIYSKYGLEFQSFFENIMEKAHPDFKRVPSGGGDGGNDGWIKKHGIYYQVYAPNEPSAKDSEAAKKCKKDFYKIKANWDQISEVKEYYFVYNDKYFGANKPESTIAELQNENPEIRFDCFLAKNLEQIVFQLDETDLISLGFHIDHRKAISITYDYLVSVQKELDRNNAHLAYKILESSKNIIIDLDDDDLSLEYEILLARCLQKLEKVKAAKEKYSDIAKIYPTDPRALLYLAEIYLGESNTKKNEELIAKAQQRNANHWLLKLQQLIRAYSLEESVDNITIEENAFPKDRRQRSDFYRLHVPFYSKISDKSKSERFLGKAIRLNPDKFQNYLAKLRFLEDSLIFEIENGPLSGQLSQTRIRQANSLLEEVELVEGKFRKFGDIGPRSRLYLNTIKLNISIILENYTERNNLTQECFELAIRCNFDTAIDTLLVSLLTPVLLPEIKLHQLVEYLKKAVKSASEGLVKVLLIQFNYRQKGYKELYNYLDAIDNKKYQAFLQHLEGQNQDGVLKFLHDDINFAIAILPSLKNQPELRRKILELLPKDKNLQKEKLKLLIEYEDNNFDEAFALVQKLDLSKLSHFEHESVLTIIRKKKAWDYQIVVLKQLIDKEEDDSILFNLKIQLFNANSNLKNYPEAIDIGIGLLEQDFKSSFLKNKDKENLLSSVLYACAERGKIDKSFFIKSKDILEKYQLREPSFEFSIGTEAEVYLSNGDAEDALTTIVDAVKQKKILSQEEYAKLYYLLTIRVGNLINLNLDPRKSVEVNTFVKLKDNERWYFIGDGNELDSIKISLNSKKYEDFISKKLGETVAFKNNYGSVSGKEIIELIFSIEQYLYWKVVKYFSDLSKEGLLEGVYTVEIPHQEDTIDITYLQKFMEDEQEVKNNFFEKYCQTPLPLALLVASEGNLVSAIGKIQNEKSGYVHFSTGSKEELIEQKNIAQKAISGEAFYIDGTSALILSESGMLEQVHNQFPNLRIPQAVISLLVDIAGQIRYSPGQQGHMGYARGRLIISDIDEGSQTKLLSKLADGIRILEAKKDSITLISSANKHDGFSEQRIPPGISDACIMAQRESLPVLTEDFLYLKLNEFDTGKKAPQYFSSFSLIRVLYEAGKISFKDYLEFFGYLTTYRFRFLPINSDDIEKAVFGDGRITTFKPENIKNFNFPLTLSKEYGVKYNTAFTVLGNFLLRILIDNSVPVEYAEKIFAEILHAFPTKLSKKEFGLNLLDACFKKIESDQAQSMLYQNNHTINIKKKHLSKIAEIFNFTRD